MNEKNDVFAYFLFKYGHVLIIHVLPIILPIAVKILNELLTVLFTRPVFRFEIYVNLFNTPFSLHYRSVYKNKIFSFLLGGGG